MFLVVRENDMNLKDYLLTERKYFMKINQDELEALDNAFNSLSAIKMTDRNLRKMMNSIRVNIKYIMGELKKED